MKLECKNISKRYGSVVALNNADLTIESGEIRGLVGGNGSGKSTLSKILSGAAVLDEAEILIDNFPYKANSPREGKEKGIVMTAQELSLLRNLSVSYNINLCFLDEILGKSRFINKDYAEQRAIELLEMLNIKHILEMNINDISTNEQYLVEFAKALIQKPKILIVDEITSALYKNDVEIVKNVLFKLRDEGIIIIYISHRLNEIFEICDNVTVLRNGNTVGTFDVSNIDENELISYMSGREIKDVLVSEHLDEGSTPVILDTKDVPLNVHNKDTSVRLRVREKEFVGIAGLEGQGQKDFLRSLFAIDKPITLEYKGEVVTLNGPRDAVKNKFAFISGDREVEGTFKERSIAENAVAVSDLVLNSKIQEVDDLLKNSGVKYSNAKDLIISLSGGNQQKVVISRWTATKPNIILADDPTKGIDIQARRDVHETMRNMLESGSSVIMISSDDEELVETSKMMPMSRVVVFYEGTIVATLYGEDISLENISATSSGKY